MPADRRLEHIRIKAFLYKFTPKFTRNATKDSRVLSSIDIYDVNLTEGFFDTPLQPVDTTLPGTPLPGALPPSTSAGDNSFFSMYDISDFISSYSFDQNIEENTYGWEVILRDAIIPFKRLNNDMRVVGRALTSTDFTRLAQYESQAVNISDVDTIELAKKERGVDQDNLSSRLGEDVEVGIKLQDLIQPYDIISVYVYNRGTHLNELLGTVEEDADGFKRFRPTDNFSSRPLTERELQVESILESSPITYSGAPLFHNEFTGFVLGKSFMRATGQVDTINVKGNGLARLFGSTRKVVKSSVFQPQLVSNSEVTDPLAVSSFGTIYATKTVEFIISDLFNSFYKIGFNQRPRLITNEETGEISAEAVSESIFDISALLVGNELKRNVFTVPPLLMALVMKRRGFSFIQPRNQEDLNTLVSRVRRAETSFPSSTTQTSVDKVLADSKDIQAFKLGKTLVYFSAELNELRTYLLLFESVLEDFAPKLFTPFEIIDEIKSKTFLEFIERPDGVILVRPPQFNNTDNTRFSSDFDIITTSYDDPSDKLVARQTIGYAEDTLGTLETFKQIGFTNGKLLFQYGFMEAGSDINPNFRDSVKLEKGSEEDTNRTQGLFKYAEYLLRIHNASLKTGRITANLDSRVLVGDTFFDEHNQKFGYIVGINKSINVSGTATMDLQLSYVRDAVLKNVIDVPLEEGISGPLEQKRRLEQNLGEFLEFEQLPRLVDIENRIKPLEPSIVDPGPIVPTPPEV